jgi:hypothetical protein
MPDVLEVTERNCEELTDLGRAQAGHSGRAERPLNFEFNARLRRRLRDNKRAIQYLTHRGLTLDTVDAFGLGLSAPYSSKKSGQEHADALVYPLRNREGRFYNKYGYYNIPDVTRNPPESVGWISGEPRTYYGQSAAGKKRVFVCQRPIDLWRHWQAIEHADGLRDVLLVSSTHESLFPEEWRVPRFWAHWETVYLGFDNNQVGESLASGLAQLIGKDVLRVAVPAVYGKDWTQFWQGGAAVTEFAGLLREAPVYSLKVQGDPEESEGYGRFAYEPVNINGAFHNGHLYYAVQILNRTVSIVSAEGGADVTRDVERLETVVVRSDRTVHTAVLTDAPKGTREKDRVMRLTDGTLIDREPQPNRYGTWSWPSIKAYLDGRAKVRPLGEILRDVSAYLRASVWLPSEEDYALLTLIVPVTFAQAIFESVPLVFVNGPAGSGKSELGRAMARVCCNAYVCGQSSAASIARFIDESRGFVVLDDMEMIGGRGGQFGELVQALKLSYNKATAVKLWTDVKTMRTQLLDFYGVKMINNTRGTGEILGSRMLRIQTRRIPEDVRQGFGDLLPAESAKLGRLRDELHSWTFDNVGRVEAAYKSLYPKTPDRSDEITAPLRVMASLAGDQELSSRREIALARQGRQAVRTDDPKELIQAGLRNLIAQGYDTVSPTHLTLEIKRMIVHGGGATVEDVPEWVRPEWVGRTMRTLGALEDSAAGPARIRLYGANLRFYPIRESYLAAVSEWYEARQTVIVTGTKRATEFCGECQGCPYSALSCEIMARRFAGGRPPISFGGEYMETL